MLNDEGTYIVYVFLVSKLLFLYSMDPSLSCSSSFWPLSRDDFMLISEIVNGMFAPAATNHCYGEIGQQRCDNYPSGTLSNIIDVPCADGEKKQSIDSNSRGSNLALTKLFVGSLPSSTTEKDIKLIFERFGIIRNIHILPRRSHSDDVCAFVVFMESGQPAISACENINNCVIRDHMY